MKLPGAEKEYVGFLNVEIVFVPDGSRKVHKKEVMDPVEMELRLMNCVGLF